MKPPTKIEPKNEAEYLRELLRYVSKKQVDKWLASNPRPLNWQGGKYSYAYCEMLTW